MRLTFRIVFNRYFCVLNIVGVHAVVRNGNGQMSYAIFNLASGKVIKQSTFPSEVASFLQAGGQLELKSCGDITAEEASFQII